jgi:isopentenyl-diphosphate Delta-isomerase
MELFDLVDKQDNVIGVTDKKKAHATGELHRVAAVYVFDKQGRLYVQIHKGSGGLYDHSVGGHISQGETYEQGAAREAEEELGITQPLEKLSIFYSDENETMQHMFGLFIYVASDDWQFVPNDEVEEIVPMTLEEIQQLMVAHREKFTGGFVNTMKEYRRLTEL